MPPPGSELVDWITDSTRIDRTIASAIPPVYAGYATIVVPDGGEAKTQADLALVAVLQAHAPAGRWWLGYLDTGAADLSNIEGQRVSAYVGWTYLLKGGGPQQALAARDNGRSTPWHSALPELLFPHDRSWLVSTLWDDDWRCLGGPESLIEAVLAHPHLEARAVNIDEDATPPGHQSS